jgi:hypothetical protein
VRAVSSPKALLTGTPTFSNLLPAGSKATACYG